MTGLHPLKIGMWCTVSHCRIVGLSFFESTIIVEVYQGIIGQFIALLEVDEQDCLFQQDDARPFFSLIYIAKTL